MARAGLKPTPEITKKFHALLVARNFFDTCCNFCGITTYAAYRWISKGEQAKTRFEELGIPPAPRDEPYVRFFEEVRKGEALAEMDALGDIRAAAKGDAPKGALWTASAWWLERRFPTRYGRKDSLELKAEDGPGSALGGLCAAIAAMRKAQPQPGVKISKTSQARVARTLAAKPNDED